MADKKEFNTTEWYKNFGCTMRFQLSNNIGVVRGVLVRIDAIEYRKYVVVNQGDHQVHINIDHIVSVEEG